MRLPTHCWRELSTSEPRSPSPVLCRQALYTIACTCMQTRTYDMTCARKRLAQAGEDANPTAQTMLALQRLSSIVEHDQHWSLACACSHTLLSRPPSFPSYSHSLSLPLRVLACGMSLLCIPKKTKRPWSMWLGMSACLRACVHMPIHVLTLLTHVQNRFCNTCFRIVFYRETQSR